MLYLTCNRRKFVYLGLNLHLLFCCIQCDGNFFPPCGRRSWPNRLRSYAAKRQAHYASTLNAQLNTLKLEKLIRVFTLTKI
jgi:hypothetical protein